MTTAAAPISASSAKSAPWLSLATVATIAAVALFLGMRLWRMTDFALDGDEIFSVQLAAAGWHELFSKAVQDAIHPPLLYVLLKLWIAVGGDSLFWLRLFTVTASSLCLIPAFGLCRDLEISPAARNFAIAIVAVHPYALYYSQHLRMYSLLMFFGLLSAWRFERYLDRPTTRNLVWLAVANLLLGYTQYYGWCVVLLEFVYLLWKRRNPIPFVISTIPAVLLFIPWALAAGAVLHARGLKQNLGWISKPTFGDLNWFWIDLTGFSEFPAAGVRGTIALLVLFLLCYRRASEPRVHWLMLLWIAPAPIAFAISQWMPQSIWGHRHLLFAIWPLFLLFADAVMRMPNAVRYATFAFAAWWGVNAMEFHAADNRKLPWDILTTNMLDADQSKNPQVAIYAIDPYLHYPFDFDLEMLTKGDYGPLGPRVTSRLDLAKLGQKAARFHAVQTDNISQIPLPYGRGSVQGPGPTVQGPGPTVQGPGPTVQGPGPTAQGPGPTVQGANPTEPRASANGPLRHFWVAWTDSSWHEKQTPPELLEQRGCTGGAELTQFDTSHRVWLAPMDCN